MDAALALDVGAPVALVLDVDHQGHACIAQQLVRVPGDGTVGPSSYLGLELDQRRLQVLHGPPAGLRRLATGEGLL